MRIARTDYPPKFDKLLAQEIKNEIATVWSPCQFLLRRRLRFVRAGDDLEERLVEKRIQRVVRPLRIRAKSALWSQSHPNLNWLLRAEVVKSEATSFCLLGAKDVAR